ncbi:unnamed protein product, partial [Coregonus sp. 'balchen']
LVAKPCAHILQIQAGVSRRAQANAVLERVFTSTTSPDSWQIEGLSKQMDWDVRKVQRWFRLRRSQDKPSTLTKFCESMWRLTFYTVSLDLGHTAMLTLSPGQYNYYVAELAFYWSLMLSQFTDIKRKDFIIMFVHHLATITLITFSYCNNMLRVGTLVMCVHDASDIFLEFAKLANYAKYQWICDTGFVVFSIVFFITRLVIYPFWIIYSVLVESWEIIGPYRSWWLLNGLLLVLQTLHVIWFYLIARIAIKAIFKGKVAKDDRSDIESSSEEETDTNVKIRNKSHPNGSEQSLKEGNGTNSFVNGETQDH